MRVSVIGPVLNEVDFIGYSIMAILDQVHEFVYSLDANSSDGTRELLRHIKDKYAHEKLVILETPTFHPSDMKAYNGAYNVAIEKSTGDACWFLHPDMLVTNPEKISELNEGPLAWTVTMQSFAGDLHTLITKGRATQWKNLHAKKLGLHYFGGYGSQNEDFYHSAITGNVYKHFGNKFSEYPFEVADSGINVEHYCEVKPHQRRFEKMKECLRTQNPNINEERIEELAAKHPRVTLEMSTGQFGAFEFTPTARPVPEVFTQYRSEFESFKKELIPNG